MALIAVAVSLVLLLRWSWKNGAFLETDSDSAEKPGYPQLHSRTFNGPGLWGMVVTLLADGALFLSILFGWLYLRVVAPNWQLPETAPLAWQPLLISGVLLAIATFWHHFIVRRLREGRDDHLQGQLWLIAAVGLVHCGVLIWAWSASSMAVTKTAHDAVIAVLLMYQLFHSGLAVIMTALQAMRVAYGYVGKAAPYETAIVKPWWLYTTAVFWLTFIAVILLPIAWRSA